MAKKKQSLKEKREAQKMAKQEQYRKNTEQQLKEKEELKKAEQQKEELKKIDKLKNSVKSDDNSNKKSTKTSAKASGLKSVFNIDDKIYMTSFGRGNDAILDKEITKDNISNMSEKSKLTVTRDNEYSFNIKGMNHINAVADNPIYNKSDKENIKVKNDMLCIKDKIEKQFFGNAFNDNIHIQIAYNIFDIEKIIVLYTNNAVYALNNILRYDINENTDLIGYMGTKYTYENYNPNSRKPFEDFCNSQILGYFGDVFGAKPKRKHKTTDKEWKNINKEYEKHIYNILAMIGQLRQWSFHSVSSATVKSLIYNFDSLLDKSFKKTLDEIYDNAVNRVNKDFIEKNKVNILILKRLLKVLYADKYNYSDLVNTYYKFIATKEFKNMGFSIRKLREYMLECDALKGLKEDRYNSVRSKLYKIIDFIIYYGYANLEQEQADKLVDSLRQSMNEYEKTDIYCVEAYRLYQKYSDIILEYVVPEISSGDNIKGLQNESIKEIDLEDVKVPDSKNVSCFSKIIYLLTYFIDGKEINELLTGLINKFDNIRSLIDTMNGLGFNAGFTREYKIFDDSLKIMRELETVKTFARMSKPVESAKSYMFKEACEILGYENDLSDDEIDKMFFKDANGKPLGKGKHDFRNFIINSVINNDRFKYLVRYGNAKKVHKLACNEKVIKFVLKQIPESQIERYCSNCRIRANSYEERVQALADIITDIKSRFSSFKKVNQKANAEKDKYKAQCQAIISLYLTVLYILVKNLVNINSRYVIGFHCVERDSSYFKVKYKDYNDKSFTDFRNLTKFLLTDKNFCTSGYFKNERLRSCVEEDYNNSDKQAVTTFRNCVAHLNAVRNADEFINDIKYIDSYYGIYHYILQRYIQKEICSKSYYNDSQQKCKEYFEKLDKYNTYVMDFTKALCVPFGYNIVRFKNLSIEALFDKNK